MSWSSESLSWLSRQVSLTSGRGADTAVLQHVTNALGRHGTCTASLENARRNEQGPVSVNCFMTAQTVASNKQRNLTSAVVGSDTQKQPETAMRKVSVTFMLILAQNLLHVGLTHYIPPCQT